MQRPKAVLFDLDDTLAFSFESPSPEAIAKLLELLRLVPVALITGRGFLWMEADFLDAFAGSPKTADFYVLPEGAAQCLQWDGSMWKEYYGEEIAADEMDRIEEAIRSSVRETGVLEGLPIFGEQFRRKRAMVAFSTVGIDASRELRYSWDPGNVKRAALCAAIARKLPEYDVVMGGATTIDVTRKGVNKAYGVRWLAKHLDCDPSEMLYVGDALFEGGNDAVVIPTGVRTRPTTGPAETLGIIEELIAALNEGR